MSKIKIFVSCHKESYVPESKILCSIQTGTALSDREIPCRYHDNVGDHISGRNKSYCELTAQYWAWKNETADYYGFFHYRRYLSFEREYPVSKEGKLPCKQCLPYLEAGDNKGDLSVYGITDEKISRTVEKYDVITVLREAMNVTAYEQYCQFHYKKDIDHMIEILCRKYPDYEMTCRRYMASKELYFGNIYVMKKELFFQYMEWLFPLLEEFEESTDFSEYNESEYRAAAYLAERLFGVYFTRIKEEGKKKCCELPYIIFHDTEPEACIFPVYEKSVNVVLAADNGFVPYLSVMLQSLIDCADRNEKYDIVILHTNIREENQKKLKEMRSDRDYISIRFCNIKTCVKKIPFRVHHHFSAETFYRYFIPDIFRDYHKVVYLDADMVVLKDIAELYHTDMEGWLIAAVKDVDVIGSYKSDEEMKAYMDQKLALQKPLNYFQAGVMVWNLQAMRRRKLSGRVFVKKTLESNWRMLDQDVMNMLCQGNVKYLDQKWNVLMNWKYAGHSRMAIARCVPLKLWQEYQTAREQPAIIHYAGGWKPWNTPCCDYAEEFWQYARKTPFYEAVLYGNISGRRDLHITDEDDGRRRFRLRPTKLEISVDMQKINKLLPAGSKRRRIVRAICGRFL